MFINNSRHKKAPQKGSFCYEMLSVLKTKYVWSQRLTKATPLLIYQVAKTAVLFLFFFSRSSIIAASNIGHFLTNILSVASQAIQCTLQVIA